ncbi:hypothetical protein SISSUDRAFT_1055806 [Sistotremastrum suecicum HHB10207 ss-3]|uniref:Uncharacterized protein n=1 Tax=Sistotremastrum suecicum HHB10207 ss-3 TaxID=1314776 RepID=A0A165XIB0_9AGAM|nr:hypothetical protein SISSUDRAFT_1055806 [Sistotremastrum suecicum HHB10207 ss-3]
MSELSYFLSSATSSPHPIMMELFSWSRNAHKCRLELTRYFLRSSTKSSFAPSSDLYRRSSHLCLKIFAAMSLIDC